MPCADETGFSFRRGLTYLMSAIPAYIKVRIGIFLIGSKTVDIMKASLLISLWLLQRRQTYGLRRGPESQEKKEEKIMMEDRVLEQLCPRTMSRPGQSWGKVKL